MSSSIKSAFKIADQVWIATALLHRSQPLRSDFSITEILEEAANVSPSGPLRSGVYVHIIQHCVANRPPNPGRYRILFETAEGRRRLFRQGDGYHAGRDGAKTTPAPEDLPSEYFDLLAWYEQWAQRSAAASAASDPLLAARGSGQQLWADEPADLYVENLRKDWPKDAG
jgi:hypothetical protein